MTRKPGDRLLGKAADGRNPAGCTGGATLAGQSPGCQSWPETRLAAMNAPVISPEMIAEPVAFPLAPVVITICTTCRKAEAAPDFRPGAVLADALEALPASGIMIRRTQCLSVCTRACTAALSGPGRYTFLFGDLDPERDGPALVEMAQAMAGQPFGFVPWKARPEALRSRIIARVPPLEWSPGDGSAPA